METSCQPSYPLNSENASPPAASRCTCPVADMVLLPARPRSAVTMAIVHAFTAHPFPPLSHWFTSSRQMESWNLYDLRTPPPLFPWSSSGAASYQRGRSPGAGRGLPDEGEDVGGDDLGVGRRHPVGEALVGLQRAVRSSFSESGAESGHGTIWSSSPCITRTGTVISFRSAVKSVWENATIPS